MPAKPIFRKMKSHIGAPQEHFRKASIRHILANETVDSAAAIPTEMYGQIRADLKHGQQTDERVRNLQREICRRIAAIEKHIRSKYGTVGVDADEYEETKGELQNNQRSTPR